MKVVISDCNFDSFDHEQQMCDRAGHELVDGHALADALQNGEIGHAGIDVHENEPLADDHPLRSCGNALLTPHMAYYSAASVERLQRYAAEEVERALSGQPLRCQVS